MTSTTNTLLLPVETLNREFDGKLLLAMHAVERGWKPVIASRDAMHRSITSFPPSVYLSKSVRAGTRSMFKIITRLGHKICALDEEALVRLSDEIYLMKTDPLVAASTDMVFAWGHADGVLYPRIKGINGTPIVETGNPRVDMMRPELRGYFSGTVDDIRRRFGRFALFNSNFAVVNHFISGQARFRVGDWVAKDDADTLKANMASYKGALFKNFFELIPRLAGALQPHTLVIRPHPSENFQTWIDLTADFSNVHVVHEGNVVPWLAAADVLVHCGCTSAVEASVIGTPAIAYEPVKTSAWDLDLPNDLSCVLTDPADVCEQARRLVIAGGGGEARLDKERQATIKRHICALDGELACARILNAMDSHPPLREVHPGLGRRVNGYALHTVRTLGRIAHTRRKSSPSSAAYSIHKFPGITLQDACDRLQRLSTSLGRFEGLKIRQLRTDMFALEQG